MIVIPAIDIIDGNVVRLSKGDYDLKTQYSSNPVDMAKRFEDAGLSYLHLVDLDGAKGGKPMNLNVLEAIVSKTNLSVDFGGGIKTHESLKAVLSSGAKAVDLGSIAVKDADSVYSWIAEFKDSLILSADSLHGFISISGWQESTKLDVIDFIHSYALKGLDKVVATDISRDGMLSGPSFGLYEKILKRLPNEKLIASGGVASYDDIIKCKTMGLFGVIVGKAYYEGRVSLKEMKEAESAC